MRRTLILVWLLELLATMPLSAQETSILEPAPPASPDGQFYPLPGAVPDLQPQDSTPTAVEPVEPVPWHTVWGVGELRAIPAGTRVSPNGQDYHPNFSLDLDFNIWLWRKQGLYLFTDMRLWGEGSENYVTNERDGFMGTSKREFNLQGGAAWNYYGYWEARAFGYTNNNLNRGYDLRRPNGFTDGFGMENRYYLSPEYAKLGQTGFDVTRATFLSIGYYPSKDMIGGDGQTFEPGMFLRAYLIYDILKWRPCYVFGDVEYLSDRSFQPKQMIFDLGVAARPLRVCPQFEFRAGSENIGDLQEHNIQNLWYLSFRYVF